MSDDDDRDTRNHTILNALLRQAYHNGYSAGVSALAAHQAIDPPSASSSSSTPPAPAPVAPQSAMTKDLPRRYAPDSCSPGYPAELPPAGIRPTLIMTVLAGGSLWFALRTRRRVKGLEKKIRYLSSEHHTQSMENSIQEVQGAGSGSLGGGGTRGILVKSPAKIGGAALSDAGVSPKSVGQGLWSFWSGQQRSEEACLFAHLPAIILADRQPSQDKTPSAPFTSLKSSTAPLNSPSSSSSFQIDETGNHINTTTPADINRHHQPAPTHRPTTQPDTATAADENRGNERDQFEINPASIPPAANKQGREHIYAMGDIHKAMAELRAQHRSKSESEIEAENEDGDGIAKSPSPGSRHESVTTSKRQLARDINAARIEVEGEQAVGGTGTLKCTLNGDGGDGSRPLSSSATTPTIPPTTKTSTKTTTRAEAKTGDEKPLRKVLEDSTRASDSRLLSAAQEQEEQRKKMEDTKADLPSPRRPLQPPKEKEDDHLFSVGDIHAAIQELSGRHASSPSSSSATTEAEAEAKRSVKKDDDSAKDGVKKKTGKGKKDTEKIMGKETEGGDGNLRPVQPTATATGTDAATADDAPRPSSTAIPSSSNKSEPEEPVTRASLARMYKSSPVEGSVAETSSERKSLSESTIDTTTSSLSPNTNPLAHGESTTEGAGASDLTVEQENAGMELKMKKKEKRERKKKEREELEAKQKEMSDAEQEARVVQDDTKGDSGASSSASSPPHADASESPSSVLDRLNKAIVEATRSFGGNDKMAQKQAAAGPKKCSTEIETLRINPNSNERWFFLLNSTNFTPSPPSYSAPSSPASTPPHPSVNTAGSAYRPDLGSSSYSYSLYSSVSHRLGHLTSAAYTFRLPNYPTPSSSSLSFSQVSENGSSGTEAPVYGMPGEELLSVFRRRSETDLGREVFQRVPWRGIKGEAALFSGMSYEVGEGAGTGTWHKRTWVDEVSTWIVPTVIRPSQDGRRALVYLDRQWREARAVQELKSLPGRVDREEADGEDRRGVWLWVVDV
ncbi:hypothetical protein B9479_004321 [Cryptococcus floricola]|uniref:Uncharacterized protein n=1 Tax=Cryptococcus floricola TaxID=2591691 RepID=A0A5D3AY47_9TREE|nr:hypothetical protein B9479_004321 [Cryptococcus floricola]